MVSQSVGASTISVCDQTGKWSARAPEQAMHMRAGVPAVSIGCVDMSMFSGGLHSVRGLGLCLHTVLHNWQF